MFPKFVRGEDIAQIVAERRGLGFNTHRVFLSMSGGLGTFDPRPHLDALPEFCSLIGLSGMRLELTVFADTRRWLPSEADQVRLLHDVDDRVPLVHLLEGVNEFNVHDNAADGIVDERLQAGRIWCLGSMGADQGTAQPVQGYATYHPARTTDWPRKVGHNAYEVGARHRVPAVSNECMRPDQDGFRVSNFFDGAANGALMCAGATFHSTSGKASTRFTDDEARCAEAWVAGAQAVPLIYQRGAYTAGHLHDSVVEYRRDKWSHARILGGQACLSVPQNPDGWVAKNGWRIVNQTGTVIELER